MDAGAVIELFDAQRLLPQRDRTLFMASCALALGISLMLVHGLALQHQLSQTKTQSLSMKMLADQRQALQASLRSASPELLADLRRQAERLEAEVSPTVISGASRMTPSQWLVALGELSTSEVGVIKAEITREGNAVLEGQALNTRAVTGYVGAWEKHPGFAALQARALELREDKERPGLLRFVLRTMPAEPRSTPPERPSAPEKAP
jgi:hypothetical protein